MMWNLNDLASITDLAKKFKVNPSTVCNWRNRYSDFPNSLLELSNGPLFSYKEVARWHKAWKSNG